MYKPIKIDPSVMGAQKYETLSQGGAMLKGQAKIFQNQNKFCFEIFELFALEITKRWKEIKLKPMSGKHPNLLNACKIMPTFPTYNLNQKVKG